MSAGVPPGVASAPACMPCGPLPSRPLPTVPVSCSHLLLGSLKEAKLTPNLRPWRAPSGMEGLEGALFEAISRISTAERLLS